MNALKAVVYKFGYPLARIYWFLLRPTTQGVKCVVVIGDKVLLVRHTYGSSLLNTVGGGVKRNETPHEAVVRETKEEVGIKLNDFKKIGEIDCREEFKHDNIHLFLAVVNDVNLTLDTSEILEANWYALDNLPTDISPLMNKFLAFARLHLS